jgi:hypothetical protein
MSNPPKKLPADADYQVGRGKPPVHSPFKKGQTGNPGGRPRGMTSGRAKALALKEAYRMVRVREGDRVIMLPAIQVILRGQVALAAKGNGAAQKAVIEAIRAIEQEVAAEAAVRESVLAQVPELSDLEVARRIAFILTKAKQKLDQGG